MESEIIKYSRRPFVYIVCKMMTIFVTRLWCVKVDPFVGNWSKRRHTETSTNQNVDRLKGRQTKISTYQNVDRPKRRQTKRWQTETWAVQFSTLYSRVFVFIILGMYCTYICTYLGMVGCTLYISTHVDNMIMTAGCHYIVLFWWWIGYKLINDQNDYQVHNHTIERDFYGEFETLHVLIAHLNRRRRCRNEKHQKLDCTLCSVKKLLCKRRW